MEEIIDRLARECAEAMVTVGDWPTGRTWHVMIGGRLLPHHQNSEPIALLAGEVRGILREAVADALRRFARTPPWPSPVGEDRLAEIDAAVAKSLHYDKIPGHGLGYMDRCCLDQQTHIAHLTRLVQFLSAESEGQAFAAGVDVGKRAGAEEQREADAAAIQATFDLYSGAVHLPSGTTLYGVAHHILITVKSAPLVTDAAG